MSITGVSTTESQLIAAKAAEETIVSKEKKALAVPLESLNP